jgi:hypothetical protein
LTVEASLEAAGCAYCSTFSGSSCPDFGWRSATSSRLLCFITIIGIPFGIANFKLIPVSLLPLGRDVVTLDEARRTGAVIEVGVPADARRAG